MLQNYFAFLIIDDNFRHNLEILKIGVITLELNDELLNQYFSLQLEYVNFEKYIKNKFENLMIENGVKYQNLTSRVKNINSLKLKLKQNPEIVNQLEKKIQNLNDLCGIRIVLYDNQQFNKIYEIINKNFKIINFKGERLDYNANNITVELKSKIYSNFRCEIQLVTVMSHNLIEIGHDIFYKDINKLEEKDKVEYDELKEEYKKCLDSVYELETRIDTLKKRKENILQNYELLDKMISTKSINIITKNESMNLFYSVCNDIKSIAPYLSRNDNKVKDFHDKGIIIKLTNNLLKLKKNDTIFSEELIFENFLEVLNTYYNLWIDDADNVLDILIEYIESKNNDRMKKSFYNMIKNITSLDIRNKSWNSFKKIKEWILKDTEHEYYRVKLINSIVQNNLEYSEYVNSTTISLTRKKLIYNEDGKQIILELFSYACDLFIKNQKQEIYMEIIDLTYKFEFLANEILNIFYNNYEKIYDYYRYDLVRNIYYSFNELILSSKYLEKINKDKFYNVWKYICYNYFDEEIEKKDRNKIEKKAKRVLNQYIRNINSISEIEVIRIIKNYNRMIKEKIYISNRFKNILFLIGKNYNKAIKVYQNHKNEYIYLGLKAKNKITEKRTDIKVLKAINYVFEKNAFADYIDYVRDLEKDILICNIIIKERSLYETKKYTKKLFQIIELYNTNNKALLYNQEYLSDNFVKKLNMDQCNLILNNYFICLCNQKTIIELDFNLSTLFEKFPEQCRRFFENIAINDKTKKFDYNNIYIYDAENYNEERKNNILLIIKLLKKKNYYEIYRIFSAIIKTGDSGIIEDLTEIIDEMDEEEDLKAVSILLNHLELGIQIWGIVRKILKKSSNQEIERNLSLAMEEIGVVTNLPETHKYLNKQIEKIKKKETDEKCKEFLNKINKELKALTDWEELNEKKMKYKMKIENEKFGEKDNKGEN